MVALCVDWKTSHFTVYINHGELKERFHISPDFLHVLLANSTYPRQKQVSLGVKGVCNHVCNHPEADDKFDDPHRDLGALASQLLFDTGILY